MTDQASEEGALELPGISLVPKLIGDRVMLELHFGAGPLGADELAGKTGRVFMSPEEAVNVGLVLAATGAGALGVVDCPPEAHQLMAEHFGDRAAPDRRCVVCKALVAPPNLRSVP
jgi:hypothetical protein